MKPRPTFIAYIFLGIGVLLLLIGILVAVLNSRASAARSEVTTGSVVNVVEKMSRSRDTNGVTKTTTTYCPVVGYRVEGRPYSLEASVCQSGYPDLGTKLGVRYNPASPADAELDTWLQRWLAPLILGGLGLVFTAFGVGFTLALRRTRYSAASPGAEVAPGLDGRRVA